MNLTPGEAKLFYDLYADLLSFVNRKLEVSAERFANAAEYTSTPPKARVAVRDALFAHRELIDEFVGENPAKLSGDELAIVGSWKHALPGTFYVFRYLKKYTVFLTSGDSLNKAYGVLGLADPLEEVIGPHLPKMITTVLLPFQGKIIYDGLASAYNIIFGGGVKKSLNEEYKQAKEAFGIITSLGDQPPPLLEKKPKKRPRKARATTSASARAKARAKELTEMTDAFCREFLDEQYAELCRKLVGALARKRPSPLLRGRLATWASGVVRTIGWVNFLDDRSQDPHLKLYRIDEVFGIAKSTGAAKLSEIRKMFRISQFDPEWTLPSKMDDNPLVWTLEVNGFLIDMRYASRDYQEAAFKKGLIPYIPADRSANAK